MSIDGIVGCFQALPTYRFSTNISLTKKVHGLGRVYELLLAFYSTQKIVSFRLYRELLIHLSIESSVDIKIKTIFSLRFNLLKPFTKQCATGLNSI